MDCLSPERLKPYRRLLSSDQMNVPAFTVIQFYGIMQVYSSALFVPIQYLEICLRNKTDNALRAFYSQRQKAGLILPGVPEEWYLWMPRNSVNKAYIKAALDKARRTVIGRPISAGDIISRLNLGTWQNLLQEHANPKDPMHFWQGIKHEVFPNATGRKGEIFLWLRRATDIRNKLFHHEPIWKPRNSREKPYNVDDVIHEMDNIYLLLLEIIGWMSPGLQRYIEIISAHKQIIFDPLSQKVREVLINYRAIKHF
jgi:hypothetical protein